MFLGLTLLSYSSALVYEDKSTQNFRFMAMANVKPVQYLIGTASSLAALSFVIIICFALAGRYFGPKTIWFVSAGLSGGLVSILLGISIGMSKYPVLATPFSLLLGIGPMLSGLNENLARILRFTYTQQVNLLFSDINSGIISGFTSNFQIIALNGAAVCIFFIWVNRKGSLNYAK